MKMLTRSLMLSGALVFTFPAISPADPVGWSEGEARLEERLQPGKAPAAYRQELRDLGYTITSTNYDTPNYVEYEVVKGDRTYEVQIDVDSYTGNATNIEIEANLWKTNRTQARMNFNESMAALDDPNYIMVITPLYTVDTRQRTELEKMVRDLERIPTGLSKGSYSNALEERGYRVLDSTQKNDRTQFRVAKNGREALVHVRFDEDTGKAEQVSAFPLLLNAGAQQQAGQFMASSSQAARSGDMDNVLRELEALPVSRDRGFYRQALRERGFDITDTASTDNRTRFEAEKNGQRIVLNVQFDENTGRSTNVDASSFGARNDSSRMSQRQGAQSDQEQMAQR
jgi:hypothetical protein